MSDLTIASNGAGSASGFGMNMPGMGYLDSISAFDGLSASYGSPFGVMGMLMNPRHINAMTGQAKGDFHKYDTDDILNEDISTLKPMAEALHEYRYPITGKRGLEKDRVGKLLDIAKDKAGDHKVAALYKLYCAMYGGLKDKNGPVTFDNLQEPGLLVGQSKRFWALNAKQTRSKEIEQLTEVAVEGGSPELAAVLLKEMGEGFGVDDKTVRAIFVDAGEKLGEAGHKRFLTAVDAAYRKLTGKTLDDYIAKEYPALNLLGIIKIGWFGANEKGREYLDILDSARQTTHHISNPGAVLGMIGAPIGSTGLGF